MSNFLDSNALHPELLPYIVSYRQIIGYKPIHAKELLPRSGATLMFDRDGMRFNNNQYLTIPLIGLHTHPIICETLTDDRDCFVIKFEPYGLSRFIDADVNCLTNQVNHADQYFDGTVTDLLKIFEKTQDMHERIASVEGFLLNRFRKPERIEQKIFQLCDRIQCSNNIDQPNLMKKDIPLSIRQLQRRFKFLIGTDIQSFTKLCKFDRAQQLLLDQQINNISTIAYQVGYYDTAHFSNNFKKGATVSPKNFNGCQVMNS